MAGSTPATPRVCHFIRGVIPSDFAFSFDIITTIAAPSLMLEALPAVTVPSFLKTGLNSDKPSMVVSDRGPSSVCTCIGSDLLCGTSTVVIWLVNLPSEIAVLDL